MASTNPTRDFHNAAPTPQPSAETDVTGAEDTPTDDISDQSQLISPHKNRKGKQVEEDDNIGDNEGSIPLQDTNVYPPTTEDEADARRVEENLRRWEIAERQRRKAARESNQNWNISQSLVGDVTRRASLLWKGRISNSNDVLGNHTALQSQEGIDGVQLDSINTTPTPSPRQSISASTVSLQDPFANPPQPRSAFSDGHAEDVAGQSLDPFNQDSEITPTSATFLSPTLSTQKPRVPPPPKPLGLPQPRPPPPPVSSSPSETPPPSITAQDGPQELDVEETRWWHDWLCACGEGPDRGGNSQAGRTNPFE